MRHLLLFIFFIFPITHGSADNTDLRTWEVFEIEFTAQSNLTNPYTEGLIEDEKPYLSAKFTGISGKAKGHNMEIPGFWNGEQQWMIRFAPPISGKWEYVTESSDRGLDNHKGSITVSEWSPEELKENPTRRGLIKVSSEAPRKGRYFVYSDGTPFLWIGDTWWNWTKEEIEFNSFKHVADTRAMQNFTVGQLFFAGNGWGSSSSLLTEEFNLPILDRIEKAEQMIRYANEKGITVWIHPWWSRENIHESIGAEKIRRWWRYVVHRLHAYNVIWVLAGEYNMHNYGGFDLSFWNDLGNLIKSEDPNDRIISAHPTPPAWGGGKDAPQWSTAEVIHQEDWLDYNQSQPGHGKWRNELIPEIVRAAYMQLPSKPIVVTEPWYEFIEGNPTAMDIRFGAWTAFLNGAAGHSYGGGHIWRTHVPESPVKGEGAWPLNPDFGINTLYYEGARSISFMSTFLHGRKWWQLEPHPEYVLENPSPYCSANPGEEYLIYLRYGGTVKIDLRDAGQKMLKYSWIDLVNERIRKEGEIPGGKISSFSPPEDYPGILDFKDWLLHIYPDK